MQQDENVLELNAMTPERQRARLKTDDNPEGLRPDGTLYELRVPEEMSPRQLASVGKNIGDLLSLWDSAETDEDDAELVKLLNATVGEILVDTPADLIEGLPSITKNGVVMGFFARSGELAQEAMGMAMGPFAFLLASSLRGYNTSTEATPSGG